MIEVLNAFTHSSDGLTDLGTVSVIVLVDTVCTVVFVVIVGIALELLGEEQRVDTDVQAGPDQNQEDSRDHSPYSRATSCFSAYTPHVSWIVWMKDWAISCQHSPHWVRHGDIIK